MNIIIDTLPNEYEGLRLNTGFRSSILFELMMRDNELSQDDKIATAIDLMLKEPLDGYKNIPKALEAITWFYSMGKSAKIQNEAKNGKNEQVYSFEEDADYIYGAFMKDYKIDLQDCDMHWWKFKSMFNSLSEGNLFCKIMGYRSVNLNEIKDEKQRKHYEKMKKQYSLKKEIYEEDIANALW